MFVSLMSASVSAAIVTTGCGGLQAAFNAAADGDVIILNQMCANTSFSLPDVRITLKGTPGAGFDGNGTFGPLLTGIDVKGTVIRDLTFQDGNAFSGAGAITIERIRSRGQAHRSDTGRIKLLFLLILANVCEK